MTISRSIATSLSVAIRQTINNSEFNALPVFARVAQPTMLFDFKNGRYASDSPDINLNFASDHYTIYQPRLIIDFQRERYAA